MIYWRNTIKICNLHDDIGNDIYEHRYDEPHRLDHYHYPKMKQGEIKMTALVCCFTGQQTFEQMQSLVLYLEQQIEQSTYFSYDDSKEIQCFIALEGLCGIQNDVKDKIQWLYQHHVRLASLCWNDDNALACGAKSGNKPLTHLGIECIQAMNDVHMAIDVSHCCEWNFYDIARISTQPLVATHSNVKGLFNHYRHLSDPCLEVLSQHHGLIGAIPVRWFVTRDESKQTLDEFIHVIDYLKNKIGVQHIALGFDFMDYMDNIPCMVDGLESIACVQNLVSKLYARGYNEDEVKAICFDNAYHFMLPYLIY